MPSRSETRAAPASMPPQVALTVGAVQLGAGVVVLVIGRLVGPHSRAPLYWGLLLCAVAVHSLRAAFVSWREQQAATLGDEVPEPGGGPSPAGVAVVLGPTALSVGFLLTDPSPPLESIYLPASVVFAWIAASLVWAAWKARRGDGRRAPAGVRFLWPMVPGFALLGYSLTAPGSNAWGCDDGATCFDGPIALSIPALIVLVFGVIAGVVGAKGSSIDKQAGFRFKALDPLGRAPGAGARAGRRTQS